MTKPTETDLKTKAIMSFVYLLDPGKKNPWKVREISGRRNKKNWPKKLKKDIFHEKKTFFSFIANNLIGKNWTHTPR